MEKARALHERTGHATYAQIRDDFGDVLKDGILEAYKVVASGWCGKCKLCRLAKKNAKWQRGRDIAEETEPNSSANSSKDDEDCPERDADQSYDAGTGSMVCGHPPEKLTTRGSNQYKKRTRCLQCDTLLEDKDTRWWSQEKEYREREKQIRARKEKEIREEMKAVRPQGGLSAVAKKVAREATLS